jgi:hypothetical protein
VITSSEALVAEVEVNLRSSNGFKTRTLFLFLFLPLAAHYLATLPGLLGEGL